MNALSDLALSLMNTNFWLSAFITYGLLINLLAFALMALDKHKATHRQWRIRERTLYIIALLGGAFGIWIGIYFCHHKTKKKQFILSVFPMLLFQLVIAAGTLFYAFSLI